MDRRTARQIAAARSATLAELGIAKTDDDQELAQEVEMGGELAAEPGPQEVPAWPEGGGEETGTEGAAGQARPGGAE